MSERITDFSVGRRWRCQRSGSVSFDFVIVGPGPSGGKVVCRLEPLPDQERIFGKITVEKVRVTQTYTFAHLRRVAVLQPISLDDIARKL